MGPPGIIIGGVAGAIWSYSRAKGKFRSAAVVIRDDMTDHQKEKLCGHIVEAFKNFDAADLAMIIPLLTTNTAFQTIVLKRVVQFITEEMRMQIID